MAYQMASVAYNPEATNRVILCSDGVANVGRTGPDSIMAQIKEHAEDGIYLTTVGFGMGNYNDVLMEQLADNGDGFYAIYHPVTLLIVDGPTPWIGCHLRELNADPRVKVDPRISDFIAHKGERVWKLTN